MQHVLVVENSLTQRHALRHVLGKNGFSVQTAPSFEAAPSLLDAETESPLIAVIIGWPDPTSPAMRTFLDTLREPAHAHLPVLILSQSQTDSKEQWVAERANTAFLTWNDYRASARTLDRLLATDPDTSLKYSTEQASQIRILLVDDSPTAMLKYSRLLTRAGYQIDTAVHAEQAFEKASSGNFDIAIIDYYMPGMNGDLLCRRFQDDNQTRHMLNAILTTSYNDQVIIDCLDAGAIECMFKSDPDELLLARVESMARIAQMTVRIDDNHQHLAGILSSVGDGVFGVNNDGLITFVNPAVSRLLGYSHEELLSGRHPDELFRRNCPGHDPAENTDCDLMRAIRDNVPSAGVETTYLRADGNEVAVEVSIQPMVVEGQRQGAIVAFRDISDRKLLQDELRWQANHDPLTKLMNRRYFDQVLGTEARWCKQHHRHISALLYLDLDRFKYINDTIGHVAGDRLLVEVSQLLSEQLGRHDHLARLGGDEFAILLHDIDPARLTDIANRYREHVCDHTFIYNNRAYNIQASIGIAIIDSNSTSSGEILSSADIACHLAKDNGRNKTVTYSKHDDGKAVMDMELGWSIRLRNALDNNQFQLYFQPIVAIRDIRTDNLPRNDGELWLQLLQQPRVEVIYEVLLRLKDPRGNLIRPDDFLPSAERFNLMPQIDTWVLRNTFDMVARQQAAGTPIRVSINLSGQCLDYPQLLEEIYTGITSRHLDPASFMFEVTESHAIRQMEDAHHCIDSLRQLGCQVALDDFGSGYSTFSQLKQLPVDVIKIDGQFVEDITHDDMDLEIVTSMANISRSLGKKTVAEYVKSPEALQLLRECGVDYVQGNYIAAPLQYLPGSSPEPSQLAD